MEIQSSINQGLPRSKGNTATLIGSDGSTKSVVSSIMSKEEEVPAVEEIVPEEKRHTLAGEYEKTLTEGYSEWRNKSIEKEPEAPDSEVEPVLTEPITVPWEQSWIDFQFMQFIFGHMMGIPRCGENFSAFAVSNSQSQGQVLISPLGASGRDLLITVNAEDWNNYLNDYLNSIETKLRVSQGIPDMDRMKRDKSLAAIVAILESIGSAKDLADNNIQESPASGSQ